MTQGRDYAQKNDLFNGDVLLTMQAQGHWMWDTFFINKELLPLITSGDGSY